MFRHVVIKQQKSTGAARSRQRQRGRAGTGSRHNSPSLDRNAHRSVSLSPGADNTAIESLIGGDDCHNQLQQNNHDDDIDESNSSIMDNSNDDDASITITPKPKAKAKPKTRLNHVSKSNNIELSRMPPLRHNHNRIASGSGSVSGFIPTRSSNSSLDIYHKPRKYSSFRSSVIPKTFQLQPSKKIKNKTPTNDNINPKNTPMSPTEKIKSIMIKTKKMRKKNTEKHKQKQKHRRKQKNSGNESASPNSPQVSNLGFIDKRALTNRNETISQHVTPSLAEIQDGEGNIQDIQNLQSIEKHQRRQQKQDFEASILDIGSIGHDIDEPFGGVDGFGIEYDYDYDSSKDCCICLPIIHPYGPFRGIWDCIVMILLVYTCVEVPFTIAFGVDLRLTGNAAWAGILALIIDILLLCDVVLNFRTAYFDSLDDIKLVTNPRKIAHRYFYTWFFIDFISSFPFEFLIPNQSAAGNVPTYIKALRIIRLVRLVKLLRFFKMLRLINRLFKTLMSREMSSFFKIMRILCLMALSAHFCACGWYGAGYYSLLNKNVYDTNWIIENNLALWNDHEHKIEFLETLFHRYSVSLYWSVVTLFTTGYGDIIPTNLLEQWVAIICILVGTCFFAYFVGAVGELLAEGDRHHAEMEDKMQHAHTFCINKQLPKELTRTVIAHMKYYCRHNYLFDEQSVLGCLPDFLQNDIACELAKRVLLKLSIFKHMDPRIVGLIALRVRAISCNSHFNLYQQGDPSKELYILRVGCAKRIQYDPNDSNQILSETMMKRFDICGEMGIFRYNYNRKDTIRCLTYCEFYALDFDEIRKILMQEKPRTWQKHLKLLRQAILNQHIEYHSQTTTTNINELSSAGSIVSVAAVTVGAGTATAGISDVDAATTTPPNKTKKAGIESFLDIFRTGSGSDIIPTNTNRRDQHDDDNQPIATVTVSTTPNKNNKDIVENENTNKLKTTTTTIESEPNIFAMEVGKRSSRAIIQTQSTFSDDDIDDNDKDNDNDIEEQDKEHVNKIIPIGDPINSKFEHEPKSIVQLSTLGSGMFMRYNSIRRHERVSKQFKKSNLEQQKKLTPKNKHLSSNTSSSNDQSINTPPRIPLNQKAHNRSKSTITIHPPKFGIRQLSLPLVVSNVEDINRKDKQLKFQENSDSDVDIMYYHMLHDTFADGVNDDTIRSHKASPSLKQRSHKHTRKGIRRKTLKNKATKQVKRNEQSIKTKTLIGKSSSGGVVAKHQPSLVYPQKLTFVNERNDDDIVSQSSRDSSPSRSLDNESICSDKSKLLSDKVSNNA